MAETQKSGNSSLCFSVCVYVLLCVCVFVCESFFYSAEKKCHILAIYTYHLLHIIQPALRALGLLLADGGRTVGRGGGRLLTGQSFFFFTKTAVTPERKVKKSIPRWEMNGHAEG